MAFIFAVIVFFGLLFFMFFMYQKFIKNSENVYFRFEPGGTEYDPCYLPELLDRHGHKSNLEGRFENKNEWISVDQLWEAASSFKATTEQIQELEAQKITFNRSNINFLRAHDLVEKKRLELKAHQTEKKKRSAAAAAIKDALPITRQTMIKLDDLGLPFNKNTTRAEAQDLIKKDKEAKARNQRLAEALMDFNKSGINITETFGIKDVAYISASEADRLLDLHREKEEIEDVLRLISAIGIDLSSKITVLDVLDKNKDDLPLYELLEETYDLLEPFSDPAGLIPPLTDLDINSLAGFNDKLSEAINEADDAEGQIKDRCLVLDSEYEIIGDWPDNNFKAFREEIVRKYMIDDWDFEDDIRETVKKHFPGAKIIKQIDE
jgi:hypothetical protein